MKMEELNKRIKITDDEKIAICDKKFAELMLNKVYKYILSYV